MSGSSAGGVAVVLEEPECSTPGGLQPRTNSSKNYENNKLKFDIYFVIPIPA